MICKHDLFVVLAAVVVVLLVGFCQWRKWKREKLEVQKLVEDIISQFSAYFCALSSSVCRFAVCNCCNFCSQGSCVRYLDDSRYC